MSKMNRIYQLALRAYPEPYRSECGAEVAHTALELRDGRWSFRETLGLLAGGIRTRSIASTTGRGSSIWMSGLRLGLLFFLIDNLLMWFTAPGPGQSGVQLVLLACNALLVVAMAFSTGIAFASATTTVALVSVVIAVRSETMATGGYPYQYLVGTASFLVAVWFVALRSDGRRAVSPLPLVALAASWFGILMLGPSYTYGGIPFHSIGQLLVLIALGVVGIAAATLDPRLLAGTLIWLGFSSLYTALAHSERFIATDFAWLVGVSVVLAAILGLGLRFGARRLSRV